jgi:hypothetical protein
MKGSVYNPADTKFVMYGAGKTINDYVASGYHFEATINGGEIIADGSHAWRKWDVFSTASVPDPDRIQEDIDRKAAKEDVHARRIAIRDRLTVIGVPVGASDEDEALDLCAEWIIIS